jgi:Smr domain-containing protein
VVKVDGDQAVVETEAARVRVNAGELIVLADGAASPSGGSRATLLLHSAPDLDERVMRLHGRDGRHHRRWRALDLHGLVLTDALERLDDFLFAAWDDNQQTVAIVHGKGAGTLRDAVRAQLAAHPAVHHFKGALPNHGGDGVTIVALYHRHNAR